jgi:hypothetical protein
MSKLNLRDIESRSWKARQQDGLFDMYLGALMLAISISALVEALGAAPVVRLITLIVLQFSSAGGFALAKRRYATPRVGAVKFGASRVRRSRVLQAALGFCVLVTAVLVVWTAFGPSPLNLRLGRYALPTVVTLVVGIPLTAIAIVLEFGRVLLHAALFAGATFALAASGQSFMAPIPGAIAFGASGAISTAIGAAIFGRFVRRVPCHPMEATADDR